MAISSKHRMRLWVLKWSLYPRRITIDPEEKGIIDDFEIIPVEITHAGMLIEPGKPPGTLPILEIAPPTAPQHQDGRYIFQSTAILEYLEMFTGQ